MSDPFDHQYKPDGLRPPSVQAFAQGPNRPSSRQESRQESRQGTYESRKYDVEWDVDYGSAEAPDVPRRTTYNAKRGSVEYGSSGIATLERILSGNHDFKPNHTMGPINPNHLLAKNDRERGREKAYGTQSAPRSSLLPPPPLPDVPETPNGQFSKPRSFDDELPLLRALSPSTYPRSTISAKSKMATSVTSSQTDLTIPLPALQTKGADANDLLEPLIEEEIEPGSFDLVVPSNNASGVYSLEKRSEQLFSVDHLRVIFSDPLMLHRFTAFLARSRPESFPLLTYCLDAFKALRAIEYANAVSAGLESLEDHDFTNAAAAKTANESLRSKAESAFEVLARDDLPAYITHVWTEIVELSMRRRITGSMPAHLRDTSEGLAEVFCLTDPSRHDNPIVFASEEFHRTTQYGTNYVIGRNCRFLQGPKTNPFSVKRIRDKLTAGKEHYETFLNYRRDGSPFMNLLMCTPLIDSRGNVRYFLGAQIDVSGLAKDCSGLESLRRLVDADEETPSKSHTNGHANGNDTVNGNGSGTSVHTTATTITGDMEKKSEFRELSEMFNLQELETVRKYGGRMHRSNQHEEVSHSTGAAKTNWNRTRVVIQDEASPPASPNNGLAYSIHHSVNGDGVSLLDSNNSHATLGAAGGRLPGVYEHYLLVRPHPSLRILFASPSLRVPGILQSHLMDKIGGSKRIRDELTQAMAEGQGVTAKVRWTSRTTGDGRPRWIHCTPLVGSNGAVGVWMVVIVDDDADGASEKRRREAPPVSASGVRPHTPAARTNGAGSRQPQQQGGGKGTDQMSLEDFAAMNRLPDDDDLRKHVRDMYEETRRREQGADRRIHETSPWASPKRSGDRGDRGGSLARGRDEEWHRRDWPSRASSPYTLRI